MSESKLKTAAMDSVGELPDLGNLLLQEFGYPHLPNPVFVPVPKYDAWNKAGTKPDHPCLCETKHLFSIQAYQYWNGEFFGFHSQGINIAENSKYIKSPYQHVQWREVQP